MMHCLMQQTYLQLMGHSSNPGLGPLRLPHCPSSCLGPLSLPHCFSCLLLCGPRGLFLLLVVLSTALRPAAGALVTSNNLS